MTSRGTPMLLMGDEFGRSQHGNNNAYCIDSPVSWVDWSLQASNDILFKYTQKMIAFRHRHPCLRINQFDHAGSNYLPSCSFHGTKAWQVNWADDSRQLAWMMTSDRSEDERGFDAVYVATNTAHFATWFDLPELPSEYVWQLEFNTGDAHSPYQDASSIFEESGILVGERSMVVFSGSLRET